MLTLCLGQESELLGDETIEGKYNIKKAEREWTKKKEEWKENSVLVHAFNYVFRKKKILRCSINKWESSSGTEAHKKRQAKGANCESGHFMVFKEYTQYGICISVGLSSIWVKFQRYI